MLSHVHMFLLACHMMITFAHFHWSSSSVCYPSMGRRPSTKSLQTSLYFTISSSSQHVHLSVIHQWVVDFQTNHSKPSSVIISSSSLHVPVLYPSMESWPSTKSLQTFLSFTNSYSSLHDLPILFICLYKSTALMLELNILSLVLNFIYFSFHKSPVHPRHFHW